MECGTGKELKIDKTWTARAGSCMGFQVFLQCSCRGGAEAPCRGLQELKRRGPQRLKAFIKKLNRI